MQILQQLNCEFYKYSVAEFASFNCKIDFVILFNMPFKNCKKGSGKVVKSVMKMDQNAF